jgi:hypothetical protein
VVELLNDKVGAYYCQSLAELYQQQPELMRSVYKQDMLQHRLLQWAEDGLFAEPLRLAGMHDLGRKYLTTAQEVEPLEVEYALQLSHAAYIRAFSGRRTNQVLLCAISRRSEELERTCTGREPGPDSSPIAELCRRVVGAGLALALGMGAAHPELRPLVPDFQMPLDPKMMKVVDGIKGAQRVLCCRSPGWVFTSIGRPVHKAEVVLVE